MTEQAGRRPISRRAFIVAGTTAVAAAGCTSDRSAYVPVPSRTAGAAAATGGAQAAAPGPGFASVPVGGGGFVTGISVSDDGTTRVVRTDGFGAYRWADDRWQLDVSADSLPADVVAPGQAGGVLALTVAPSDASRAYLAYDDSVFRSDDSAQTWTRVLADISTSPNDDFRSWGDRLVVDPRDADVVYYGTQLDGLLVSVDGGGSWTTAAGVPAGQLVDLADPGVGKGLDRPTTSEGGVRRATAGISAVAVDGASRGLAGRSSVVYAASYGGGVLVSEDGGETWSITGPPEVRSVSSMRVMAGRRLVVVSRPDPLDPSVDPQVWLLDDNAWTQVTPPRESPNEMWRSVAVDPFVPGRLAVIAVGGRMAISPDDGRTWRVVFRSQSSTGDVPWLAWALNEGTNFMTPGELLFDPVERGRLWMTEGTGVWYADLGDGLPSEVVWNSQARGIEQLVSTDVVCPPDGRPVMTAWDRPIFRSEDLQTYPSSYGPVNAFSSAWSVDWSGSDPTYLVASVANHQPPGDPSTSGFSSDGGRTWSPFPTIPLRSTSGVTTFGYGTMAVGVPGNIVWVPAYGRRPQWTDDGGGSWSELTLPGVTNYGLVHRQPYYVNRKVVASDKAKPAMFYLFVHQTGTFRSTDGARTWEQVSDDRAMAGADYGWNAHLESVPGREGELYLTPGVLGPGDTGAPRGTDAPLLRSTDGGATWSAETGLTGVSAVGFGAPLPSGGDVTVFAAGYLDGTYGIYRSIDDTTTWTLVTTYPAGRTPEVAEIDGDKDVPGRVYLAVGGSGWVYGGEA